MYTEVSAWTQSFEICISHAKEIFPEIKKFDYSSSSNRLLNISLNLLLQIIIFFTVVNHN